MQTVGVLTATVALIYVIFQVYFDWSWPAEKVKRILGTTTDEKSGDTVNTQAPEESTSGKISNYFWVIVHFPFHLALVMVMEGATQFVIWWKVVELINYVSDKFYEAFKLVELESATNIAENMVVRLNETVNFIWELYPRDLLVSHFHREALLETISGFSDEYLKAFPTPEQMEANLPHSNFTNAFRGLKLTTLNSILQNFNIEAIKDEGWDQHPETYEEQAFQDAADEFYLVVRCLTPPLFLLLSLFSPSLPPPPTKTLTPDHHSTSTSSASPAPPWSSWQSCTSSHATTPTRLR